MEHIKKSDQAGPRIRTNISFHLDPADYKRLQAAVDPSSESVSTLARSILLNTMEHWDGSMGAVREKAREEQRSAIARTLTMTSIAVEFLQSRPEGEPRDERDAACVQVVRKLLIQLSEAIRP